MASSRTATTVVVAALLLIVVSSIRSSSGVSTALGFSKQEQHHQTQHTDINKGRGVILNGNSDQQQNDNVELLAAADKPSQAAPTDSVGPPKRAHLLPGLHEQLHHVESAVLPQHAEAKLRNLQHHFTRTGFNQTDYELRAVAAIRRRREQGSEAPRRPHEVDFTGFPTSPVPGCRAPRRYRPDLFCTPNLGRDWDTAAHRVFPLPYAYPREQMLHDGLDSEEAVAQFVRTSKTQDCAKIVPRVFSTYTFKTQDAYMAEYRRSLYCITFKKGGWDVLRHYEIIAAGCIPYLIDVEYTPEYALASMPKRLLREARDLPGVEFDCVNLKVVINHDVFDTKLYASYLHRIMMHAREHMTTTALARYVLSSVYGVNASSPKAKLPKMLFLHRGRRGAPLRAQGSYSSWMLFHGLKHVYHAAGQRKDLVESHIIPFLYNDVPAHVRAAHAARKQLYGGGFGYAYLLDASWKNAPSNEAELRQRIAAKEFDVFLFGEAGAMASGGSNLRSLAYLPQVLAALPPSSDPKLRVAFVHPPDIAYANPRAYGYDVEWLYTQGTVLQREIMDCGFYTPAVEGGDEFDKNKARYLKRCVYYRTQNCFDDVNIGQAPFGGVAGKNYPVEV
eukprot:PhM_4_TR13313/c1_g1_i1/m.21055